MSAVGHGLGSSEPAGALPAPAPDPAHALTPSGNLRRRLMVSRIAQSGALAASVIAVAALLLMIYLVTERGIGALSWSFLTSNLPVQGATGAGGGIGPAILGTIEIVAMAILVALPAGLLVAIYLHEFATPKTFQAVRALIDVMNGLPTIVVGVFIFALFVAHHGFSAWSGSLALAIVVLPMIARSSLEAISRVPLSLYEAAHALGVSRWRIITGVVLPSSWGGILTAVILAMARASGETAPLLFTTSQFPLGPQLNPLHGMATLPYIIWELIENGSPAAVQMAWGAAFVLLTMILLANVGARRLLRRSERKRGL